VKGELLTSLALVKIRPLFLLLWTPHFLLKVQKGENDRNASQHRIEEYIRLNLLVAGTLLAKGIPNEARPDENKPTNIRPAQWQNLRFSIDGRALDEKGETVYKALEIGKAKGL